jgi:hypothetical protein
MIHPLPESPPPDWVARLRSIRTAKARLIVCFCTFPLYVFVVSALVRAGKDITVFMLLYMLLYAAFGINAAVKRCPRCHQQFYVKAFFLNIFTRKCAHCGLHERAEQPPDREG